MDDPVGGMPPVAENLHDTSVKSQSVRLPYCTCSCSLNGRRLKPDRTQTEEVMSLVSILFLKRLRLGIVKDIMAI